MIATTITPTMDDYTTATRAECIENRLARMSDVGRTVTMADALRRLNQGAEEGIPYTFLGALEDAIDFAAPPASPASYQRLAAALKAL